MPNVDGQFVTPDVALERDHCPECGADFSEVDAIAHRREHWHVAPPNGPAGEEGRRRIKMYDAYLDTLRAKASKSKKEA